MNFSMQGLTDKYKLVCTCTSIQLQKMAYWSLIVTHAMQFQLHDVLNPYSYDNHTNARSGSPHNVHILLVINTLYDETVGVYEI